ncbi:hypothetical protein TRFO_02976 [Tritrichomonas foetus]|uniref:Uncharacterized protein n=1 Tax=Tritrichomonas foetus TaxID=1144522 RepID=A0A1J4KTY3_9EUKA|nr:hypothetical protein TRFO_02976 [Tritrichomonas foetus]|eukprot:OHT14723.1 hypothetical protein TRFO_02976 [Tritrichomonas foetus]
MKFEENDKIEDKSDSELDDFGMFDKGEYTGIFDNMNQMMNPGTISAIPSNTTVIQDSPLVPDMIFDITSEQEINVINESDDDEIKIENDQKINVQNENNKKENDNKEVQSIVNLTNDRENPPHMMGMLCLAEISTSDDD